MARSPEDAILKGRWGRSAASRPEPGETAIVHAAADDVDDPAAKTEEERLILIPDTHKDLLERPLFAHMATVRPDGEIQNNPMWFAWDGEYVRMTTSTARQKFRNVEADPRVTLSVNDPDRPYRYLELRGRVVGVEPDTGGEFFGVLAERYGLDMDGPPSDRLLRVALLVEPVGSSYQ